MYHFGFKFLFLVGFANAIQAQSLSPQLIASAGGFASVSTNSLAFTVGQPIATMLSGASGSLSQGFQQSFKVNVVNVITAISPLPASALRIFPNPTRAYLQIEGEAAILTLTDVLGRPRWQGRSDGKPLLIDLHDFADGVYLLHVQTSQINQSTRIVLQR
ncbi:T9SS type A sorting domain-containing protein [Spirosoma aureum]|uniref:T9SS type A sorting domain-containing protein n=1 Tax=Spirosoma aureum TaxID=2692134 RepID=A0A6G9AW14_9BACT|nr:T9SS type A sorting domain-containing protein [Spirosoma aureum]QIP16600.1 T9SS type A sorting domain-containing protein [Spirosoma aureum]